MSTTNSKLTVFLDTIGRTIIGKVVNGDDSSPVLSVENPALVHIQPNPATNQLQLQIIPLFFKEFLADKNESTVWLYRKDSITLSKDITFAAQFEAQYTQIFAPQPPLQESGKVVKLFDEE